MSFEERQAEYQRLRALQEQNTPTVGKHVKIIAERGRARLANGKTGRVVFYGVNGRAFRFRKVPKHGMPDPKGKRDGYRVAVEIADMGTVVVPATSVEVLPEKGTS